MTSTETYPGLQELRDSFPEVDNSANSGNTLAMIRSLVMSDAEKLTDSDRALLDVLSRKLDVAKRLCLSYDLDWKKPVDRTPVPSSALLGVAVCMIQFATNATDTSREQALKWINTAFNATDLARQYPDPDPVRIDSVVSYMRVQLDEFLVP